MHETARRTLLRSITYRLVSVTLTLLVAYLYSGDLSQASVFAVASQGVVSVWYYIHERLWLRVQWGLSITRPKAAAQAAPSKSSS